MYPELSDSNPALPLVRQARAFITFARAQHIPLTLYPVIYRRFTAEHPMTERPFNEDLMMLAACARGFADGHPAGQWLAAHCAETTLIQLACERANAARVGGVLAAIELGFFVDDEVLAQVRSFDIDYFAPSFELRETWIKRRMVEIDGRLCLCERDAATLLRYADFEFGRLVSEALRPEMLIEVGTERITALAHTYPFLRRERERGTTARFFDPAALIACCRAASSPRALATERLLRRVLPGPLRSPVTLPRLSKFGG